MSIHHDAELRAFHLTAKAGSMSLAAKRAKLTQPTISAHINKLEALYGLELFYRKGRRLELTAFGLMLHEVTNRMYEAETEALSLLEQGRLSYKGTLRLCAVGPFNVMPIIGKFRDQHPNVHISLGLGDSAEITDQILNYRSDVGVLVHAVDDIRIDCIPYRKQPLVIFASKAHPLSSQRQCRLADLAGHHFVLREQGSTTRSVFMEAMSKRKITIRCSLEIGSRESLHEAVALNLGLGIVSEAAYRKDPRTVILPIQDLDLHTHVHLISRVDRASSLLIARFKTAAINMRESMKPKAGNN